ncbi:MAG TPA: nucleotide sugar dehydrogenase [Planctomycetota bacterium]|nr:nucleotide sugar dehydrogenase [Planctomycetota bacterium]
MARSDKVAIVGVGRVGLPFALYLAEKGMNVHGIDVDEKRIATLRAKAMPFMEAGAQELLDRHVGKRFHPTTDVATIAQAETVIVTLGTPVDEHLNPEFEAIEKIFASFRPHLRKGQLVILRSTVMPGTTEFMARKLREWGLDPGKDLHLAFCPERIAEGKTLEELPQIPQLVGGLDSGSRDRAAAFFEGLTGPVFPTDARSAEIGKLFCNVYRYVDFAIGNEFMMIADQFDRDVHEIVDLVNKGYKRAGIKRPGMTGGPCLYKDGFFLVERTPYPDLLTTAWKINESVPAYLIEGLAKRMGTLENKVVAVLGLSFKKEIDDTRNSLSFKAIKILGRRGAAVLRHDPYVLPGDLDEILQKADAVLVCTDHDAYKKLGLKGLTQKTRGGTHVADVWNVFQTGKVFFEAGARAAK